MPLGALVFLLQPVFLTLTMNISSFKVTYSFLALVFSVYVAALQSGRTAFSGFLFFAQTDGITFIWIPLCQLERRKKYENDNF